MKLFDLHCDTLTELSAKRESGATLLENDLHVSLNRARGLQQYAQVFAVYTPAELSSAEAYRNFYTLLECLKRQLELFPDKIALCTDHAQLCDTLAAGKTAALLSLESMRPCMGSTELLCDFYAQGVRVASLTWNERNSLADGVGVSDAGGLTALGREFVAQSERLGIVLDVSHLSERGFWDMCECATRPFIATHSNSREVCSHPRNLDDNMFREIVRRGGLAGINFCKLFLQSDCENASADSIVRHTDRFMSLGGQHCVAMGADYDGAGMPPDISGVDRIGAAAEALLRANYPETLVEDIFFGNALRFFSRWL